MSILTHYALLFNYLTALSSHIVIESQKYNLRLSVIFSKKSLKKRLDKIEIPIAVFSVF